MTIAPIPHLSCSKLGSYRPSVVPQGILLQISHPFFSGVCKELGYDIGDERDYGIGMFFLPQNETDRRMSMKMFEIIAKKEGVTVLGWRIA